MDKTQEIQVEKKIMVSPKLVAEELADFQKMTSWLDFGESKTAYDFFTPYQGQGAAMKYSISDSEGRKTAGDAFLRKLKNNSHFFYQIYSDDQPYPTNVKVDLTTKDSTETWVRLQIFKKDRRFSNLFSALSGTEEEEKWLIEQLGLLEKDLKNRMGKEQNLNALKMDSIFKTTEKSMLVLGTVSALSRDKDTWEKSLQIVENKAKSMVINDLGYKENQLGNPVMLLNAAQVSVSGVSMTYGYPVTDKKKLDNFNFNYLPVPERNVYTMYHTGSLRDINAVSQRLQNAAKADQAGIGKLSIQFLKTDSKKAEYLMKVSLSTMP